MGARSFFTVPKAGADPGEALASALRAAKGDEKAATAGALVFTSGGAAREALRIADAVRRALPGTPACIVPAAGIMTERGETEGAHAIGGIVWSIGRCEAFVAGDGARADSSIADATAGGASTAIMFARELLEGELATLPELAPKTEILGAGTIGPPLAISRTGELLRGRVAGLVVAKRTPALVVASSAMKLLGEFASIEEADDGIVRRVGGKTALEALGAANGALQKEGKATADPLFLAAIADEAATGERPPFIVRPLRGVDPDRGAVRIGPDAVRGARLAFGVRDAAAAKEGFDACLRGLKESAAGSVLEFAVVLTCAGRGSGLYGAPDVEARLLRQRLGDIPFAGMHSAFEIGRPASRAAATSALAPKLLTYTAVVGLFRAPS